MRRTTDNTRDDYPQKAHFIVLRMVPVTTLEGSWLKIYFEKKSTKNEGEKFFSAKI